MNANELADAIRGCGDCSYNEDAYIMLRQQQSEIESLKAENKFFKDLMGDVEILRGEK